MTEQWLKDHWYVVLVLALWDLVWKGLALWKSARENDKPWFALLLVLNTLGILPIAYIFVFSKRTNKVVSSDK